MRNSMKRLWERYVELPVTAKASLVFLIVNLLQKGIAFIINPIFVRLMSPEEFGQTTVYYTDYELVGTIAMFALSAGCFDVGMQDNKEDRNCFSFSVLVLSNVITIITALVIAILFPYISTYLRLSKILLWTMVAGFLLSPAMGFWSRQERYAFNYRAPAIVTVVSYGLSTIAAVVLVYLSNWNRAEVRVISAFAVMVPVYLFFWIYVARRAKFKVKAEYIKFAFLFNLPLIPHYLSSFVLNSADRIMIANIAGDAEAAFYGLAYSIAVIITMIWTSINSSLVPYYMDKYEKKEYDKISEYVMPILTVFAIICLLIVLMAPEIIRILGTEEYYPAVYIVPSVVCGIFFMALYYIFTNALYYYKKPQYVLIASITAAVLNIILNYYGISRFGYLAAGYTTMICYLVQAFIDCILLKHVVGKQIYNIKYIVGLSSVVIVLGLFSSLLYNFVLIRWIIIFALLIIVFKKRKILKLL